MQKCPRPKLRITRTPSLFRVHYLTLERHLAKVYRLHNFSVLRASGAIPGLYPEYLVRGVIPLEMTDQAARIRTGASTHSLALILAMLCVDGDIPAGRYVIDTTPPKPPLDTYKAILQRTLDPLHPECIRFKTRHESDAAFRKIVRVIERSLLEWLKKARPEKP